MHACIHAYLDGHARAMEAEGEEGVLAQEPVEARGELLRVRVFVIVMLWCSIWVSIDGAGVLSP